MKVASTTLVGAGTEHLLLPALASAAGVADLHLVLDTRPDGAPELPSFAGLRRPVHVERLPWPGRFDEARNAALGAARRHGATWALTLDTDEQLWLDVPEVRATLARATFADVGCFQLWASDKSHCKERLVRCASAAHWTGPVHEELVDFGRRALLPGSFSELPKTPEQLRVKFERDAKTLKDWLIEEPLRTRTRWLRYIADSCAGLGRHDEAEAYFLAAARLPSPGRTEERGYSALRAAEMALLQGAASRQREHFERAGAHAVFAIALDAGFAREASFVASRAALVLGNRQQAERWARLGLAAPVPADRVLPGNPSAQRGCAEVLAELGHSA